MTGHDADDAYYETFGARIGTSADDIEQITDRAALCTATFTPSKRRGLLSRKTAGTALDLTLEFPPGSLDDLPYEAQATVCAQSGAVATALVNSLHEWTAEQLVYEGVAASELPLENAVHAQTYIPESDGGGSALDATKLWGIGRRALGADYEMKVSQEGLLVQRVVRIRQLGTYVAQAHVDVEPYPDDVIMECKSLIDQTSEDAVFDKLLYGEFSTETELEQLIAEAHTTYGDIMNAAELNDLLDVVLLRGETIKEAERLFPCGRPDRDQLGYIEAHLRHLKSLVGL